MAIFGQLLGRNVFDCFADSTTSTARTRDARATGEVVEFAQYYDGYVMLNTAKPLSDALLAVYWEIIGMLDTMNLDALRLSLSGILAKLEEYEKRTRLEHARTSLQVIEGGA